jgi:hypothetical protein
MTWPELRYRPHIARHGGEEIVVVVRDRELSDAQESGMELDWFLAEVAERTRWCDFEPLVTTATDGENGGWFRNVTEGANYWSAFYLPWLERIRDGAANLLGMSPRSRQDAKVLVRFPQAHPTAKASTSAKASAPRRPSRCTSISR